MNENSVRQIVGTGATINVFCGFIPGRVTAVNIDSALGDTLSWNVGMADGSAFKTGSGTRTKITTGGITVLRDPAFGYGFSIGPDAAVNIAGQRIVIQAERGGEGNQEPSYSSLPTGA
jgi:hypothetical protein